MFTSSYLNILEKNEIHTVCLLRLIKIIAIRMQLKTFTIEKPIEINQQYLNGINYRWFNNLIGKLRS